jgi:hypothetical protein
MYQKQVCQKMAEMGNQLKDGPEVAMTLKRRKWFEASMHVFNLRWNQLDNFRIDKYLMFIRFQLNAIFTFLKETNYDEGVMKWYNKLLLNLFLKSQKSDNAVVGIPLQICDVMVEEMNKVVKDASLEVIASLLQPILDSMGLIPNGELKERIVEKVFTPLMENNKTEREESSDEEEMAKKEKHHRYVDGGKLPPKTQREIEKMLKRKFEFPGFNNLIYAQNYIFKLASETDADKIKEGNRDALYKLYDFAHQLEPKPDREELTFSQMQLINKASSFVTLKMRKRQNIRMQKQEVKELKKVRKMMQNQLSQQSHQLQKELFEESKISKNEKQGEDQSKQPIEESKAEAITPQTTTPKDSIPVVSIKASKK